MRAHPVKVGVCVAEGCTLGARLVGDRKDPLWGRGGVSLSHRWTHLAPASDITLSISSDNVAMKMLQRQQLQDHLSCSYC